MKPLTTLLISCTAAAGIAASGWAQQQQPDRRQTERRQTDRQQQQRAQQQQDSRSLRERLAQPDVMLHHVADIHNKSVENMQGENLGNIDTLIADVESGKITHAVVSVGGFLGVGDTLIAVPWHAFQMRPMFDGLVLDVTRSELEAAPSFQRTSWPDFSNEDWAEEIDQYYGSAMGMRPGMRGQDRQQQREQWRQTNPQQQQQHQVQQLQQRLEQSFTRAGMEREEARDQARELAQQFMQERPEERRIQQMIEGRMRDAGVQEQQAQQEARRVAGEIHSMTQRGASGEPNRQGQSGQTGQGQSNQGQSTQMQQRLEQSFTRVGMEREEARDHARELAQQIMRERPEERRVQQMIEIRMRDAGVQEQQAQQEARRIAGEIHTMTQRSGGQGQAGAMFVRTAELVGTAIENRDGESLGDLNNIAMDVESGDIEFAVVGTGGFLGMWQSNVAVPWQALNITQAGDGEYRVVLNATQEQLERAPEYETDKWPTPRDVEWASGVFPEAQQQRDRSMRDRMRDRLRERDPQRHDRD